MSDPEDVAIVVLWDGGRVLVRRRRAGEHLAGLWEFPGGKVRAGETPVDAAARELREEMSVEAVGLAPREIVEHDYDERRVRLHVFEGACRGVPRAPDGAQWRWVAPEVLPALPMPEANRALVRRLAGDGSAGAGAVANHGAGDSSPLRTLVPPSRRRSLRGSKQGSGPLGESGSSASANLFGDSTGFPTIEALEERWRALAPVQASGGSVALIVARPDGGAARRMPRRVRLTHDAGVPGDRWTPANDPDREMQITVMQLDVASLIANGLPLTLFGDNLFLDSDLSAENLPPGSRMRVGRAVLEVTPKPHTGCAKFRARFGQGALRFVSKPELRGRNLRGVHMRVVTDGEVEVGDPVRVVARTGRPPGRGEGPWKE